MSWFTKHITLVYLPEETSLVKKFRLPLPWATTLGFIFLGILFAWGWVLVDYYQLRSNVGFLEKNKQAYFKAENRIQIFKNRQREASLYLDHLKELHFKLKSITSSQASNFTLSSEEIQAQKLQVQKAKKKGVMEIINLNAEQVDEDLQAKQKRLDNLLAFYQEEADPLSRIPNTWPVRGLLITEFGIRFDTLTGQSSPQQGIVFATRSFAPVIASAEGIVEFAGPDDLYEHLVIIDHGNGIRTRYGNLASPAVKTGDPVRRGQVLAQVAGTGRTTGPQLYYEVLLNYIPQNPVKFLPINDQD